MGQGTQEPLSSEPLDDLLEPMLDELIDDEIEDVTPLALNKKLLADKRRKAEQRLEEKRLRDELGFYDLEFDDI
ncbi:MAG: hypothetical protein ABJK20_02455 [Halieaceae bacterium]